MRHRVWLWGALLALGSCGGGGGGQEVVFRLTASTPSDGETAADIDSVVRVSFSLPADPSTLSTATVRLETGAGIPVPGRVAQPSPQSTAVNFEPNQPLVQNARYRLVVSASLRSSLGTTLGADRFVCFITRSDLPTVRPDQILDLGDRLNVPRHLAGYRHLADGRDLLIGGYSSPTEATDTLEVYEAGTRTFRLLAARMGTPRAEHSVATLLDGRILISGGVAFAGGPPLATTEIFDPFGEGIAPGPPMKSARRGHASSGYRDLTGAMVSGGYGASGDALDTIEVLDGGVWGLLSDMLPAPTAQHLQVLFDLDRVYFTPGNFAGKGALWDGFGLFATTEGDIRFRTTVVQVASDTFLFVGGDTRSAATFRFSTGTSLLATDLTFQRRGAHSLTGRGGGGMRYLLAGGFNIAAQGQPALATLEVMDYLPVGNQGQPDVNFYEVPGVTLPVPFAGHVGFREAGGATVLAGGFGGGVGPHSRRVVLVLDEGSSPSIACGATGSAVAGSESASRPGTSGDTPSTAPR